MHRYRIMRVKLIAEIEQTEVRMLAKQVVAIRQTKDRLRKGVTTISAVSTTAHSMAATATIAGSSIAFYFLYFLISLFIADMLYAKLN